LRLPLRAAAIKQVTIDGRKGGFSLQAGVGFSWLLVETPAGRKGEIRVSYEPASPALPLEMTVKQGDSFELNLAQCAADDLLDPQNILKDVCIVDGLLRGVVKGEPGPALLYLSSAGKKCPSWIPLAVRVEPKVPQADRRWVPPDVPARDLSRWKLIDLRAVFNSSPAEASDRVYEAAQPPPLPATKNGFWYWRYHLTGYWPYTAAKGKPGDAAWRGKVGTDGVAWTTDGIPFRTVKEGPNIGIVTLAGGFPAKLEFPVHAAGETLYLMISGITFPAQSHVANLRVNLRYADGQTDRADLVPPFDLSDCWGKFFDDYGAGTEQFHKGVRYIPRKVIPSCGFENIGGRIGPAGSSQVDDPAQWVTVDTEAKLVPITLRRGVVLDSVEIEAMANDVIFGVMGATIV